MVYYTSRDLLIGFVDGVVLRVNKSNEKVINKTHIFGNRTGSRPQVKF
jgi:hypothetical protein